MFLLMYYVIFVIIANTTDNIETRSWCTSSTIRKRRTPFTELNSESKTKQRILHKESVQYNDKNLNFRTTNQNNQGDTNESNGFEIPRECAQYDLDTLLYEQNALIVPNKYEHDDMNIIYNCYIDSDVQEYKDEQRNTYTICNEYEDPTISEEGDQSVDIFFLDKNGYPKTKDENEQEDNK